jgi:hypothetical protein
MSTVVQMRPLESDAELIRAGWSQSQQGRQDWIEGSLKMIQGLSNGRSACRSDRDFNLWLIDNELDYLGHQDRAALLNMGQDLGLAKRALEESDRTSYQLIWREWMKPRFTSASKPPASQTESEKPTETPVESVDPQESAPPTTETAAVAAPLPASAFNTHGDFAGKLFTHSTTCSTLRKLLKMTAAPKIRKWFAWSVEQGFLIPPEKIALEQPTFRLLFPRGSARYVRAFDLTKSKDREYIAERLIPAMTAERGSILADPEGLEAIVRMHWQTKLQEQRANTTVERSSEKSAMAGAIAEQEVIYCGERVWPKRDNTRYGYAELCVALWAMRDLCSWLRESSPGSQAIEIRLLHRWYSEYLRRTPQADIREVFRLMDWLTNLLERNPTGECRLPMSPKSGEWV